MYPQTMKHSQIILILVSTVIMSVAECAPMEKDSSIDFTKIWYQHTNQIIQIYDHLLQWEQENQTSTEICRLSIKQLINDANNGKYYANKMIDSTGRPTSGILEGRFTYLGRYEECIATTNGKSFSGKYCVVHIKPLRIDVNITDFNQKLYHDLPIKIGVCLPSTCSTNDVSNFAANFIKMLQMEKGSSSVECMETTVDTNENVDLISLSIFCGTCLILFLMVIAGTLYDHISSENILATKNPVFNVENNVKSIVETIPTKMLLAFSIKRNLKKIFQLTEPTISSRQDSIEIFHGMKFVAMIWIICTHSISFSSQWINFNNPLEIKRTSHNIFGQILMNGSFSVDCFFFMSGYLVMHSLRHIMSSSKQSLKLTSFYLNRYIRMTPTMMFIIGFGATMLRYFGSGPEWTNSTSMFDLWCRKNWWLNMFYLHNFINTENMCLSHSWYSAVDTQFFLISPILIIALYRKPWIGTCLSLGLLFGSIATTWSLTFMFEYPAFPFPSENVSIESINKYYKNIYIKPYCRIGPYIVGLLLAFIMNNFKMNAKLTKTQLFAGWTFTIVSTLGVIVAMLPASKGEKIDLKTSAAYSSTSRIIWALGISWITFVSLQNQGSFIQKFLSWKLWKPFGRLTYSAYLVHPIIIALFYGSRLQTFDYSFYLIFYFTISNICITYVASLLVALFIEYPIISIGKLLLKRKN